MGIFKGSRAEKMKKLMIAAAIALTMTGCNDAQVASSNLSKEADSFQINRRTVFYNSFNGEYILSIEGKCSIKKDSVDNQLEVTCKTSDKSYKKHFLGISDNVTYFSEQIGGANVSTYHYKVIFKPQSIIPDVDIKASL